MSLVVPLLDLSAYAVGTSQQMDAHDDAVRDLATQLVTSLEKFGLLHLTNHGISQEQIVSSFPIYEDFFKLPIETKRKYKMPSDKWTGWIGLEECRYDKKAPADLCEWFSFWKHCSTLYPTDSDAHRFTKHAQQMTAEFEDLSCRLMRLLAIGLQLQDTDFFKKRHNFNRSVNASYQQMNYYPPVAGRGVLAATQQMRKGEHSDGSMFSLLLHNDVRGLEVKLESGDYTTVSQMKSGVLLMVGDMLQRWTADRLRAVVHRVVMPDEANENTSARQSVVYFVVPDADKLVECLDGSDKYPPIYPMEYNYVKFSEALGFDESIFDRNK